jgi:hypothetical protein
MIVLMYKWLKNAVSAEYLERAVAACRASFGLMHMPPNYKYNITRQPDAHGVPRPTVGYSPENILHGGDWDGFSGFNWGGGGAATAAAYLELKFGGALVNIRSGAPASSAGPSAAEEAEAEARAGQSGQVQVDAVGIDGVTVEKAALSDSGSTLTIAVANALASYGYATAGETGQSSASSGDGRALRVTVRCEAPCAVKRVVVNGVTHTGQTAATLLAGLPTTV